MSIGLLTAFLGGVLALLSPCAALLMPAFFAARVGAGPRLLLHGAVFYVGLLTVLVPIGIGAGALGSLVAQHRAQVVLVTAGLMVVLGIAQALGYGFDASRWLPGVRQVQARATVASGLLKTLLLGAASGVAGFCAGPILGAVLTLAAAQGKVLDASILLAAYGAGMVVPLVIIAAWWQRLGASGQRALRGRAFTALGREWHSTSVITGTVLVLAGVLFWLTNGLVGLPEVVPTSVSSWIQERSTVLSHPLVDAALVIAVAVAALVAWQRWQRRAQAVAVTDIERKDDE